MGKDSDKSEIIKSLEALVESPGYVYALAFLLLHDLFLDTEKILEIDCRNRISPPWPDTGQPGGHTESLRRTYGEVAGEKLGTDPVERSAVNVGTDRRLPPRALLARRWEGARSADSRQSGRSLRSSRRPGKPATGRRETASWQRRGGMSEGRW
jgi:hypothetical protein